MIEGYMKFYSTGVLVNVGAVNPCVKSKTNHLHANTGVRKSISDSRTLHWLTQVATICIVTVNVLWLFLTVPWVALQCVIVVFPDYTHLPL